MRKPRVCAIIAAGGAGTRMKVKGGKQFMLLCGKPVLLWTIEKFEAAPAVSDIVLVVAPEKFKDANDLVRRTKLKKVRKIVRGGKRRQDSVANALAEINFSCDVVLVHDGARPLVSKNEINAVIKGAQKFGACLTAIPVKDTLKIVRNGKVAGSPDRRMYFSAQTPQGFSFNLLKSAYSRAAREKIEATDDGMLVERMGQPVQIVPGSCYNLKITTPEDRIYAEVVMGREQNVVDI